MHTLNGGLYPEMTTVNGAGKTVDLTSPKGLIKWISAIHSDFDGNRESDSVRVNPFIKVIEAFRNIGLEIVHIVQVILGL